MPRLVFFSLLALVQSACSKSGPCAGKDLLLELSGNHGHSERIAAALLRRGAGSYELSGGSHDHSVRLDATTLEKLKSEGEVELRTSSQNGHVHSVRLKCDR